MAASLFSEKFAALTDAAQRQRGLEPSEDLRKALNRVAALPDLDVGELARLLVTLTSPTGAGFVAVWLGAGVEDGRDPALTWRPILDTFLRWSRTVETAPAPGDSDEDEAPPEVEDPEPDEETIAGMRLLGQALVAHLARSPEQRRQVAAADEVYDELERVAHLSYGATWLLHLLKQVSGQLVVLDVGRKQGYLVRYANLTNCFHLFTLLQGALAPLVPDAGQPSAEVLAIALGESQDDCYDRSWWHYGQPYAPTPDIGASIWGEAAPDSIASVDGQQVLLLWPPILESRTWDAGFFSPILYASLPEVEVTQTLPASQVDAWWSRLNLPAASHMPAGNISNAAL